MLLPLRTLTTRLAVAGFAAVEHALGGDAAGPADLGGAVHLDEEPLAFEHRGTGGAAATQQGEQALVGE